MTVETTTRKQSFDGGQSELEFSFRALPNSPSDIKVKAVLTSTGAETDLDYGDDYTVDINSDGVGGTVTISPTYSTLYTYTVYRETTTTQESDYEDYNQFPADTLETDLDRLMMIAQERSEDIDRAVKLAISSSLSDITLPAPSASTLLGWNSDGDGLENKQPLDADVQSACEDAQTAAEAAQSAAEDAKDDAEAAAASIPEVDTDGTLSSNSDLMISSQKAIKTYVDTSVAAVTSTALQVKVGTLTRSMTATSGTIAYTGIGFAPKVVMFSGGVDNNGTYCIFGAGTEPSADFAMGHQNNTSPGTMRFPNAVIALISATISNSQLAGLNSLDEDGFTLGWALAGTPSSGTATIGYVALG